MRLTGNLRGCKRVTWYLGLCLCLAVSALALGACNGGEVAGVAMRGGPRAWLDQPPGDLTLPLGPYMLRAHANAEADRVRAIRFMVNDIPLGSVSTDPGSDLAYAEFNWNPSVAGEYLVQAIAVAASGAEGEPAARVCVETAEGSGCPKMADEATPSPEAEIEPTPTAPAPAGGGMLVGFVMSDLNEDRDGLDPGEGPLEGAIVSVTGCDENQAVSGADGRFEMKVRAGRCDVQVTLAGWDFMTSSVADFANPVPVVVRPDAAAEVTLYMYNKKAAEDLLVAVTPTTPAEPGVIEGLVAADLNEDGDAQDAGEGPMQGVTVSVSGCASGSTVTGAQGNFGFKVPPGNCQLQVAGGDWVFISAQPSGAAYPVPVAVASNASSQVTILMYNKKAADDVLTAITPTPTRGAQVGVLIGAVMSDLNDDGDAADRGEGPLQGATVSVSGCAAASAVSNWDGVVEIKLPAAACQVQVSLPDWTFLRSSVAGRSYPVPVAIRGEAQTQVALFMYNQKAAMDAGVIQPPPQAPTPTPTTPPKPLPGASIAFWADRTEVKWGECTNIRWAVEGVQAVYLEVGGSSQGVTGNEARQVCPASDGGFYRLRVLLVGGGQETRDLTIGVVGSPPPQPPPPPPPAQDTTPPVISSVAVSAKNVYYGSCGGAYPTGFSVDAVVEDDPSGISDVILWYAFSTAPENWLTTPMYRTGGNTYSASVDISGDAYGFLNGGNGQLNLRVVAVDGAGNNAKRSGSSLSVEFCPG